MWTSKINNQDYDAILLLLLLTQQIELFVYAKYLIDMLMTDSIRLRDLDPQGLPWELTVGVRGYLIKYNKQYYITY